MSSWVTGLWGGRKTDTAKETKDAIVKLRENLDMLTKREKYLQDQADEQQEVAKKLLRANNKNGAKHALRKKKNHEDAIEKIAGQQINIMDQMMSLENATMNQQTLESIKAASKAMANINKHMTPDQVDNLMDKLRETQQTNDEIAQAINQPINQDLEREDELEEEFKMLEEEHAAEKESAQQADVKNLESQLASAPVVLPRPGEKAPSQKNTATAYDEDDEEIRKLQAEMSI